MRLPPIAQLLFHYTAEVDPDTMIEFLKTSFPISTPQFTFNTDKSYVLVDMPQYIPVLEKVIPYVTDWVYISFGDYSDPTTLSRLVSAWASVQSLFLTESKFCQEDCTYSFNCKRSNLEKIYFDLSGKMHENDWANQTA